MTALPIDLNKLRGWCLCAAISFAIVLGMRPAEAQAQAVSDGPRLALVIGNGDYDFIDPLDNPVNDAHLIRGTLEELGFEVIFRENIGRIDMERVIAAFNQRLRQAGPDATGLFYYAGHAVQSNGENFLLPTDVEIEWESDLRFNAVRTSDLMAGMEQSGANTKILILDACRSNPFLEAFGRAAAGRGLAQIGLGNSEFFVAFAATSGNVAEDGTGRYSPYAEALARHLPTMNSDIANTFRLVRIDVSAATGQRQLPEDRSTLRRDFYFAGGPTRTDPTPVSPPDETQLAALDLREETILGSWCSAGRSAGLRFDISGDTFSLGLGRDTVDYRLTNITTTSDDRIRVTWVNRGSSITFEFGDFSPSGSMMTQIRGIEDEEEGWQDYNRRFRRCG